MEKSTQEARTSHNASVIGIPLALQTERFLACFNEDGRGEFETWAHAGVANFPLFQVDLRPRGAQPREWSNHRANLASLEVTHNKAPHAAMSTYLMSPTRRVGILAVIESKIIQCDTPELDVPRTVARLVLVRTT